MSGKKAQLIQELHIVMDIMQDDPELEDVDTLAAMENVISATLYYFTGERRYTRDRQPQEVSDNA